MKVSYSQFLLNSKAIANRTFDKLSPEVSEDYKNLQAEELSRLDIKVSEKEEDYLSVFNSKFKKMKSKGSTSQGN